jgi:hypothetical protein
MSDSEEEEVLIGEFAVADSESLENLNNHELAKYLIQHAKPEELFNCLLKQKDVNKTARGSLRELQKEMTGEDSEDEDEESYNYTSWKEYIDHYADVRGEKGISVTTKLVEKVKTEFGDTVTKKQINNYIEKKGYKKKSGRSKKKSPKQSSPKRSKSKSPSPKPKKRSKKKKKMTDAEKKKQMKALESSSEDSEFGRAVIKSKMYGIEDISPPGSNLYPNLLNVKRDFTIGFGKRSTTKGKKPRTKRRRGSLKKTVTKQRSVKNDKTHGPTFDYLNLDKIKAAW